MHRLVPSLIIDNLRQDNFQGRFPCTGLFVDISGFTKVTETLMGHGQHGAEVMATIMRAIFATPVRSVFKQGGFVTNFAGDAFTAVFPFSEEWPANPSMRALAAAWQIQKHMAANRMQQTRYGAFEFLTKVGLAEGEAIWGILPGDDGQRAAYYFKGSAIVGCANAEYYARPGDIIGNQAVYEATRLHVQAKRAGDHWRINQITTTLPKAQRYDLPAPDLDQMARFFPRTLLEQEISGEFRQVLNLFINLQGTPDHGQLNRFVQHLFQLQDKYGGVLSRIDFADKGCHMLLFWGAPSSHENDIIRALDFISECRRLSEIPLRAGVTYRIAHAGSIGCELAEEYTCYGRGVNMAARQMMAAGWDEIWVDGETSRRAEGEFSFEPLGSHQFKGFAEAQPVYLLTGYREDVPSPFADRPLAGRQEELDRLQRAVQPIYDGRFGGVVVVVGEAGIGKSRLVYELLEPMTDVGGTAVFLCQTDEIIRQSLNPFRYFLRHYFDQSATRDEEDNKSRFSEIMEQLLAAVSDSELRDELERTSSFLGSLVGLFWEGSLYEQLEPELRFENTLNAIKTLFRAESRRQPVVIQLEDVHWLDPDSKEFLDRLTRNMADYPLILLVTSREDVAADLFAPDVPLESIHLEALGQENLAAMAQAIINRQPAPALLQLLEERTGGNPFYAEQMLLYLRENDLLDAVADQVDGAIPGDVYIPTDVRALLTARLDRLPSRVKDVVQNAAVLGREFEVPILFEMMAKDPELERKLETAAEESVWIALDEVRYLFQHALLRDAAYDMQLHSRLRQLHKSAAEAFEDRHIKDPDMTPRYPEIAYHFDKAEEGTKASHYYGEAGEQAKENYSNNEAISYFSRGLELVDYADYRSRYKYLCGRETIYQWLGKRNEQQSDLKELGELLEQQPDDLKQADLALRQSSYALVTGDYDAAITFAKSSLSYAGRVGDFGARAKAHHRHGRTLWQQGKATEAEVHLLQALNLARNMHNREIEAECLHDLAMVYRFKANYVEAKSFLSEAFTVYSELGDERGIVQCQNLFGIIGYELGNLLESNEHYLEALEVCRNVGLHYWETHILLNIGNSFFDLGDYQSAGEYHVHALNLSRETGDLQAMGISLDTLGLVSQYQNKLQEAIAFFRQALDINESIKNQRSIGYVLTHLGYALLDIKHYGEAKFRLEQGLHVRNELQAEALAIDSMAGLALVAFQTDKISEALDIVTDILSYLKLRGADGIEQPVFVYLICYRILSAASEFNPTLSVQAQFVLNKGYIILDKRRSLLTNEEIQSRFIEQVPFNRDLHEAWIESRKMNDDKLKE